MKKKKSNKKAVKKSKPSVKKAAAPSKSANKNSVGVTPLGDRVLVKPIAGETTTAFGIIIPDSVKEKPETGTVVAVGPGKKTENGIMPMSVNVGEKVMFSKYGFDEVKVNGEEYYLISESNILAVLD